MLLYGKTFIFFLFALTLVMSPLPVLSATIDEVQRNRTENPPDPGAIIVDLIAVRPLGILATIAGSAVFIVSVPFAALGGNTEDVWQSLVVDPAEFTFKRPLGVFEE